MQKPLSHLDAITIMQRGNITLTKRTAIHTGRVTALIDKEILARQTLHLRLNTRNMLMRIGQNQRIYILPANTADTFAKHRRQGRGGWHSVLTHDKNTQHMTP